MRGGFLNPLKPGQGATLQAVWAAIAEFGLLLVPAAVHAALLALFHRILPRGPAT